MGQTWGRLFPSGSGLSSAGNDKGVSEETKEKILGLFKILHDNPKVSVQSLEHLLPQIPEDENILLVYNEEGYNILQKCVGDNNLEMVRWILSRNPDLNHGACSFPLHIACLKGYNECAVELIRNGARIDVEARMCWPGPHSQHCEERVKCVVLNEERKEKENLLHRSKEKPQSAIYYAVDGDAVRILQLLLGWKEEYTFWFGQRTPILHTACERGAWKCTKYLVSVRSYEINMCHDEYYPVHHAVLHDTKFLNLLIANHASTTVVTATGQMTLLHILFMLGSKSANDTLRTCRLLLKNGLKKYINAPDSLGNTPLHGLIVRYALEEAQYRRNGIPWNKWDMMLLVHYLLQNGGSPSINQPGNSALACVLRHVKDWEIRYDLLSMFLQDGGNPNISGRDGSAPLMVCLVPLINNDPLYNFTHSMKVCYLNCIRILCKHGANPNCLSRSNLSPLHILVFTAFENIPHTRKEEKALNFEFIKNLILLLLKHGIDPNVRVSRTAKSRYRKSSKLQTLYKLLQTSQRSPHILQSIVEMVKNTRVPPDMDDIYDLILTLIQYGANPNINVAAKIPVFFCHSQNYILMKKSCKHLLGYFVLLVSKREEILYDPDERFVRVLYLLYMCMDHKELYGSLKLLIAQQIGVTQSKGSQILYSIVKELYSTPRSLKQLCRLTIYKCLDRRPGVYAEELPLPVSLKAYVLDFRP